MVYEWKTPMFDVDPNAAGAELEQCRDEHGIIKPRQVVARARSEASPIHTCFDWNDETAAEKYRDVQARTLIRNIVTVVETNENKRVTVNAFVNLKGDEGRGYKGIVQIMQSPIDRAQILEAALNELNVLRKKYQDLSELACVFAEVDRVAEQIS